MPTQLHLPAQPVGAREIDATVALGRDRGDVAYINGLPITIAVGSRAVRNARTLHEPIVEAGERYLRALTQRRR